MEGVFTRLEPRKNAFCPVAATYLELGKLVPLSSLTVPSGVLSWV